MRNKSYFVICSAIVILTNVLMFSLFNNGEEIGSNLFVIAVTLILLPSFLFSVEKQGTYFIRLESSGLLLMTALSLIRFVNRIDRTPIILNSLIVVLALGCGIVLISAYIVRIYLSKKK